MTKKMGEKGDIIQVMDLKHPWYGCLAVVSGSNDRTATALLMISSHLLRDALSVYMAVPKLGVKDAVFNHDQYEIVGHVALYSKSVAKTQRV